MKDKIILCPGKIPIKSNTQPWYVPYTDSSEHKNLVLCESCYKTFGGMMDPICFKVVFGNYVCNCSMRTFDKSSVIINNIRVSFMNPNNFFRYRVSKFRNEITINIPRNEPCKLIVENLETFENKEKKISVEIIEYNETEIHYHDKKYPQYLIIDMDDQYNKSSASEKFVKFRVNKWERMKEKDMKQYYQLVDNTTEFKFKLNYTNGEIKVMNHILDINEKLPERKEKIILIEDYIH